MPKGFGSENMSGIKMLKPSDGVEGITEFVLDTVIKAGSNPCPPIIVGVGIGGTFEKAALMAKKALLRSIDSKKDKSVKEKLLFIAYRASKVVI
jgi:fumarate hydratase subunit alpha